MPKTLTTAEITQAFRSQDAIDRVGDALVTVLELEPNAVIGILALVQTLMMRMLKLREEHADAADQVTMILQQLMREPRGGVH